MKTKGGKRGIYRKGEESRSATGRKKREQVVARGIDARSRKPVSRNTDAAATALLDDLKIPVSPTTFGLARQHVQLLEAVDRTNESGTIDGRALGGMRMVSQEAGRVLDQLRAVAAEIRKNSTSPMPLPPTGVSVNVTGVRDPAALRPVLAKAAAAFEAPIWESKG